MDKDAIIGIILGLLLGLYLTAFVSMKMMNHYREKAVSGGIARYEVNIKNGSTDFRWNDEEGKR